MRADLPFWVAISHEAKIGPQANKRLFSYFGNMETAWKAPEQELRAAGLSEAATGSLNLLRQSFDPDQAMKELEVHHISVLTREDEAYPFLLKNIHDAPSVLYVAGTLPTGNLPHLAIVGSRHATNYGKEVAHRFAKYLAQKGVVIVSGLAFGIDEMAHSAALETKGKTIAVLASGLLNIQTSRGRYLAHKITAEGGAVISEFAPHAPSFKTHFPIRNRIISGLCKVTLVVEAAQKSGSLITARAALDQNRDVFAVPGSVFSPTSEGTHDLLRQGAGIAARPEDLEEALHLDRTLQTDSPTHSFDCPPVESLSAEETQLLTHLSRAPIHTDDLVRASGLSPAVALPILTVLSLKGRVRQLPGNYYIMA